MIMNAGMHNKVLTILVLLCGACTAVYAKNQDNWQVVIAEDPLTRQTACLMISSTKITQDGQGSTPVYLVYNGSAYIAKTKSNIDTSYQNSGLQVGDKPRHKFDRLFKKSSAIFESQADAIRDEFIRGLNATLTLGFWPSWPKTTSYTINFNLRGFTKTYNAFKHCRKTGEIPLNP